MGALFPKCLYVKQFFFISEEELKGKVEMPALKLKAKCCATVLNSYWSSSRVYLRNLS